MDARLNPERVSSMESQYGCPCLDWMPTVYSLIHLNIFHSQTRAGPGKSAVPVLLTRDSTNAAASVWLGVSNTLR